MPAAARGLRVLCCAGAFVCVDNHANLPVSVDKAGVGSSVAQRPTVCAGVHRQAPEPWDPVGPAHVLLGAYRTVRAESLELHQAQFDVRPLGGFAK